MDSWHDSNTSTVPLKRTPDVHDRKIYKYPRVPNVRSPAQIYNPGGKQRSQAYTYNTIIVQSSASSDTSRSSEHSRGKQRYAQPPAHAMQASSGDSWQNAGVAQLSRCVRYNTRVEGHGPKQPEVAERPSPAVAFTRQQRKIEKQDMAEETDHAVWILFWLSVLDPVHSLASCLFSLITTLGLLIATPIRLFQKQSSLGDQVIHTLAPLFRHHLEMIYAPSRDEAFSFEFAPTMLIATQVLSPVVSIGVMFAAWVSGAFWVFATIMGNPDGTERRDDGADAVVAVRNWWERYLLRALNRNSRETVQSQV